MDPERKIKVPLPQPVIRKLDAIARRQGRSREKQARAMLLPAVEAEK